MSSPSPDAQRPLPSMFRVTWLVVAFALRRSQNVHGQALDVDK